MLLDKFGRSNNVWHLEKSSGDSSGWVYCAKKLEGHAFIWGVGGSHGGDIGYQTTETGRFFFFSGLKNLKNQKLSFSCVCVFFVPHFFPRKTQQVSEPFWLFLIFFVIFFSANPTFWVETFPVLSVERWKKRHWSKPRTSFCRAFFGDH